MSERDELAKAMRAAKTLGEIIEKQCRDVLDVTGLHHLINEDGDGHWDVVWMRLFEMRDELANLKESTIGRERLRGDKWRDRAQEADSKAQTLEMELRATTERAEAAEALLAAADAHDQSHGIRRIALDDATVERAAEALRGVRISDKSGRIYAARAVLAAAVKEEQ